MSKRLQLGGLYPDGLDGVQIADGSGATQETNADGSGRALGQRRPEPFRRSGLNSHHFGAGDRPGVGPDVAARTGDAKVHGGGVLVLVESGSPKIGDFKRLHLMGMIGTNRVASEWAERHVVEESRVLATMTDAADRPDTPDSEVFSVPTKIGAFLDPDDMTRGGLRLVPGLIHAGSPRAAAFMMVADIVVGARMEIAFPDDWAYTTDYSVRMTAAPTTGLVRATARPLRHGRRVVVEECEYRDEFDNQVAYALASFTRAPMREGDVKLIGGSSKALQPTEDRDRLERPLEDEAGITVADGQSGQATLEVDDRVRRSGGFVQGAITTLLAEVAATSLAEAHHGCPCAVKALDARYLLGGRSGPLVAKASWLGGAGTGQLSVMIIDQGHDDVVTSTYLIGVEPQPDL